jgi:GNAT superfamily N-acetyltransferase
MGSGMKLREATTTAVNPMFEVEYLPRDRFGPVHRAWVNALPQAVRWEVLLEPGEKALPKNSDGILARVDGRIVGAVELPHGHADLVAKGYEGRMHFVTPCLCVLPEHRGRGIARAMLAEVPPNLMPGELMIAELVDARRHASVKLALEFADIVTPTGVRMHEFNTGGLPVPAIALGPAANWYPATEVFCAKILERYAPVTVETAHALSVWVLAHYQATMAHRGEYVPLLDRMNVLLRFNDRRIRPSDCDRLLKKLAHKAARMTLAQMERHVDAVVQRLAPQSPPRVRQAA